MKGPSTYEIEKEKRAALWIQYGAGHLWQEKDFGNPDKISKILLRLAQAIIASIDLW